MNMPRIKDKTDEENDIVSDYAAGFSDAGYDREWTAEQRKQAASEGEAMPGGGFPIKNRSDLSKARRALGRAKNRKATITHIKKRAKALGAKLPSDWPEDEMEEDSETFSVTGDAVEDARPVTLYDAVEIDAAAKVRYLDNGFMVAQPRIARSGIQLYSGYECGMADEDATVRVYRPQSEVFSNDAMRSYTHMPITNDHPGEMVDSKNWSKYSKGDTGDEAVRDGGFVRVPMMLKDHSVVEAFKSGKKQLSVGYGCQLDFTPGVVPEGDVDAGKAYDCVQYDIRGNHLAVVTDARGGPKLSIGDETEGTTMMADTNQLKTVMVDGIECQMTATAAALVDKTIKSLEAKAADAKKKSAESEEEMEEKDEAIKKADALLKTKDAQIATLEAQLKDASDPAKLDQQVKDRQAVTDKARKILGDKLVVDGRSVDDIRSQVVTSKLGDAAKGWDAGQVRVSFDTLTAGITTGGSVQDMAAAFSGNRPGFRTDQDPRTSAYNDMVKSQQDAWKGEAAKTAQ
jgi:hypothetical protein